MATGVRSFFSAMRKLLSPLYRRVVRPGVADAVRFASVSPRIAKILLLNFLHRSDYKRWGDSRNLETWWVERTEKIAQLVPQRSRVIEFGAGRRQLEKFLDSSCSYVPSDLTDRGPGTIVCDLNRRPLQDFRQVGADTAVFGGVLEYILDLESLVQWLSVQFSFCVASYTYVVPVPSKAERFRDRLERLRFGYMNNYTEEELVSLFEKSGFHCVKRESWTTQRLFLFARQPSVAPKPATSLSN